MSSPDNQLDAAIQAVPLPDGLLDRLRAVAWADDADLDAVLGDVTLPEGLLGRLAHIPLEDDEGLDEALRNVPVPSRLGAAWRRRGQRGRPFMLERISRFTTVASLLMAIGLAYVGAMVVQMAVNHKADNPDSLAQTPPQGPAVSEAEKPEALVHSWGDVPREEPWASVPRAAPPRVELQNLEGSLLAWGGGPSFVPSGADLTARPAPDVLGSIDNMPELPKRVVVLSPRGVDWPMVAGSNQAFLRWYGVHPFVAPAVNPKLQSCLVPLGVEPSSYELTRRCVEEGELPPPDCVRTEDFLKAIDYEFPMPNSQAVAVSVTGGPSPFRGEGFALVQVGVRARAMHDEKHNPVHLVLLVDTSASMRWGGRVEMIRRALRDIAARLGPDDRLSLISFSDSAHLLIQNVRRSDPSQFMAALDSLQSEGSTNVDAGLDEAYLLAMEEAGAGQRALHVAILTDGWLELEPGQAMRIERRAADMAGRKIPLSAIDLGQENKQSDDELASISRAGRGKVYRANSVEQVRWSLQEIITGRSQLVARGAQLKVTFNPKTVAEYRLIGHEANGFAGMMPGRATADLYEGQSATALFEVRLAPNAAADVLTAEVTWSPPEAGRSSSDKAVQKLEVKQFAASFAKAAPSLQGAAIAAEMAEVLRRSPFVREPRPAKALYHVWEVAGQVDSRLYQRTSFAEFASLVHEAVRAKPARLMRRP